MFTVDLHSHILPGIDDGADDVNVSIELLRKEASDGVRQIVLSPHFNPINDDVQSFLERRTDAFHLLLEAIQENGMADYFDLRLAAEIRYAPSLLEIHELDQLCISGTKVLLIEFSFQHQPEFVREVFYRLQTRGFLPLMAHVERFQWLQRNPEFLYDLVCDGAYAQVNADSIINSRESLRFIRRMMKCGLIHCIGSDTHNMTKRPPYMKEAGNVLLSNPGMDVIEYIDGIGCTILRGEIPSVMIPSKPKKSFLYFFIK